MINRVTVGLLATNCWIIPIPRKDGCVLVDPGGDAAAILRRLEKLRLAPRYIVITHAHFDHVMALPEIAAAYPEADIAVHGAEAGRLGPGALEMHRGELLAATGDASCIGFNGKPLPAAGLLLSEGGALGQFTVLHLPGHSPGSIGLLWNEEKALISGDTLFRGGVGRTDFPGGDVAALRGSLRRLFALDGDIQVYPGHGETTTIRREQGRISL